MPRQSLSPSPSASKMDFRRSGPLDERRRRVLMDEIASPADGDADATAAGGAKGPVRAYHEAVLNQRQPKVTDLLPVRPLWVVVLLLAGLTGIATVEAIHVHAVTLPVAAGAELLAPLDADRAGSLAAWYSSAMLAAGCALSVVIFSIRAHRIDDYRGRYRIWLWTAAALTWLSLDAATGVHNSLGLALTLVASKPVATTSLTAAATLTWIAVYALMFGTLGLRLLFELWPSRLSLTALLFAAFLYGDAALLELEIIQTPVSLIAGTLESTLTLLAHLSLLSAVGFYARHVLLDASGRLKVHINPDRKTKTKRAKLKVVAKPRAAAAEGSQAAETAKARPAAAASGSNPSTIAASASAGKPGVTISKNNLSSPDDYDDDEEDDEEYGGNLSKSERRRLKKLARREQQRRAA